MWRRSDIPLMQCTHEHLEISGIRAGGDSFRAVVLASSAGRAHSAGRFLAAVRLEFNEPDLNAAGGYLRVAPGDVVEVVYVGSEEDEEEKG